MSDQLPVLEGRSASSERFPDDAAVRGLWAVDHHCDLQ